MSAAFNICSSVSCIECNKEHFSRCPRFQPLSICASRKHEKQLDQLFGEDLTKRSVLQDLNDVFFGNQLLSTIKKKKSREFLEAQIAPVLLLALAQMKQARPKNPVEWLADWLTLQDPANK